MRRRRLPHGSVLLALLALLAALAVAGCGADDEATTSDDGPDPATIAPADAFLYGEVAVRPGGDLGEGAREALSKVLRVEDPGAEIVRLLDDGFAEEGEGLTYGQDVEPWLGETAGGFLLLPAGDAGDPDGAVALAVTDREALDATLDRLRDARELRAGDAYDGVEYYLDDEGDPGAVVGDFLVVASSLEALRAAIDASRGTSLADEQRFEDAAGEMADDALAFLFVDPQAAARVLDDAGDTPPAAQRSLDRLREAEPVTASLTATADEIAVEATGDTSLVDATAGEESDAEVTVGQLPGDAWFALATPPLGPIVREALDAAGVRGEAADQVRQALGIDLDRDLLEPLGGLGLFARGTNPLDIGGGALLQMTDAASAQRLVTRLQAIVGAGLGTPPRSLELGGARGFEVQIPQSPQPIVVLAEGDRIAAGYAASSAQDLLDPQERFDESDAGSAAIDTLGDDYTPSLVVLVPQVATLLRSLHQLEVADLSSVIPYVSAYRSLAIGTKTDGERQTVRVVAALR